VALAEELRPDLILMDVRLRGERDGIDAAIEIRKRFDIPCLVITSRMRIRVNASSPHVWWASSPSRSSTRFWRLP
jgi:two-component system, response regulator PdtaR